MKLLLLLAFPLFAQNVPYYNTSTQSNSNVGAVNTNFLNLSNRGIDRTSNSTQKPVSGTCANGMRPSATYAGTVTSYTCNANPPVLAESSNTLSGSNTFSGTTTFTNSVTLNGSTSVQSSNFNMGGSGVGTSGWEVLPGGLYFEWVSTSLTASGGPTDVTLPQAFPTGAFMCICGVNSTSTTSGNAVSSCAGISKTQIEIYNYPNNPACVVFGH